MATSGSHTLKLRPRRFVDEFIVDLNATQAAIRAGYSKATAAAQASRLLTKVNVREAIETALAARSKRTQTQADWVLERLKEEAEADIADIYNDDSTLKPISEWPLVWRKGLVTGIKVQELFEGTGEERKKVGDAVEIKASNRIKHIELLGKHIDVNAFRESIKVDPGEGMREFMEAVSGQSIGPKE